VLHAKNDAMKMKKNENETHRTNSTFGFSHTKSTLKKPKELFYPSKILLHTKKIIKFARIKINNT